jgi:hypothetical protein
LQPKKRQKWEGLIFARKWIDGGRPPLRERGTGSS